MPRIHGEFERPLREVAAVLRKGEVIGAATDSVYALLAALDSRRGVATLREIRRIPPAKPLALLLNDFSRVSKLAFLDRPAYRLIRRLTPGHFTFILRATKALPRLTLTRQRTVGIRIIECPIINALCEAVGGPLVSASAARPEGGYAETAEEVAWLYPEAERVLDRGPVSPAPSTVIDLTGAHPEILRIGTPAPPGIDKGGILAV
ncbi:MAG: threonylcarbamoyl-AMP synthase [Candidatus Hydrogenedentota bacterium]|nr:MAG: threonylcarbamoyl-AMP synthase [Candidatus Hydrogenedentota bacterium]